MADEPFVARKLDEIAAATRKTETALATFQSRREQAPAQQPAAMLPESAGNDGELLNLTWHRRKACQ